MRRTVDDYLQSQSDAGQYDSSDVFTLDTLKMGRKMAAFQLPEPGLWVVKLVQAATAMKAERLSISFQKRTVRVDFLSPSGRPDAQTLLDNIFRPDNQQSRALQHLTTGLRACLAGETHWLTWNVCGPEGGARVLLSKDATRIEQSEPWSESGWLYSFEVERPVKQALKKALRHRMVDVVRQVGDEYTAVVSRCWCAPLPIEIDGVDLETSLPHPAMRHLSDCRLVDCGVDRYHMGDHWLALRAVQLSGTSDNFPTRYTDDWPEGPDLELSTRVSSKESFLRWPRPTEHNGVLLVSFASLAVPGIDFIHDGVLVDQEDFPYTRPLRPMDRLTPLYQRQAVGFRLFVTTDPEHLDLSGFAVRDRSELGASLYQQIRPELLDTFKRLQNLIENYRFAPSKKKKGGRMLNHILAPLAAFNHGFTISEARRTLEQLHAHVQKAPSRSDLF
jgi:hypothetical protein